MRALGMISIALLAGFFVARLHALQPSARLAFAERPQLISCEPATSVPCFRTRLNFVDALGNPLPIELPKPRELASDIFLSIEGNTTEAFFAAAPADSVVVKSRI